MREAVDQPTGGEARHPGTDHGDTLAEKEELEIAVAQGSPGVRQGINLRKDQPSLRTASGVAHYRGLFFIKIANLLDDRRGQIDFTGIAITSSTKPTSFCTKGSPYVTPAIMP